MKDNPPLIKHNEIAATVILYHPDDSVIGNLHSYVDQVDVIFAIDNTEKDHVKATLLAELTENKKIVYSPNNENLGIAKALNIGARSAIQAGYKFLLTMDQDSKASSTMVADLINCDAAQNLSAIGILSPFHATATDPCPPAGGECFQILTAWTSGSLLNLEAYRTTGLFTENLFIDFVDHEYCLRLNLAGYKIFKVNNAILTHELGNGLKRHRFLWTTPVASNHSALRRYYITRNRFHVASRFKSYFPNFFKKDLVLFWKDIVVIFLFEKNRFQKYKMIFNGFFDYKKGILGKCPTTNDYH